MKVKTSEAKDQVLDYLVAVCAGFSEYLENDLPLSYADADGKSVSWNPSTNWAQGGPIIEREKLGVWWATHYVDGDGVEYGNHWYCETGCTDDNYDSQHLAEGPTPLIAAMRCYVASKLGDEVEIPEELK